MPVAYPITPLHTADGIVNLTTVCDNDMLNIRIVDGAGYRLIPVDIDNEYDSCLLKELYIFGDVVAVIDTSLSGVSIVDGCGCGDSLTWCANDGYPIEVTLTNSDGVAIDVTGWDIIMYIGDSINITATITDGPGGVFTVDIPKDMLSAGYYDYSFKHVTGTTTRTLSGGRLTVV